MYTTTLNEESKFEEELYKLSRPDANGPYQVVDMSVGEGSHHKTLPFEMKSKASLGRS